MPEMDDAEAWHKAQEDAREGKSPSTQAGEFVREEIHHIREGKHGARSTKQAIAIGLSKARRAGVKLPPPGRGKVSQKTRRSAQRAYKQGQKSGMRHRPSARRSRATMNALKREGHSAASHTALSRQAHKSATRRGPAARAAAARKAVRTKGPMKRAAGARKAARTRSGAH